MTRMQFEKVFRRRPMPGNTTDLKYMTVDEFKEEVENVARRGARLLQMPPIVKVKEDQQVILDKDERIQGYDEDKLVITDITFGTSSIKRLVLVRQPDGTLQHAPQDIRKRCNQIYFPLEGRKITTPLMFNEENMKRLLEEHNYEFILDRMIVQFDPFEQEFHDISSQVYQHINETKNFEMLRSTRYFGPMAFFFAWHKMTDDLVVDNIKRDYLRHAVELILLQYKLHAASEEKTVEGVLQQFPDRRDIVKDYCAKALGGTNLHETIEGLVGKSNEDFDADDAFLEVIEAFIKNHALKKAILELAVQTFKEEAERRKLLSHDLQKQHGISS